MLLKRKYLFGTTILAGVIAATAAPAFAQSAPAQDGESTQVEEVVVTGSRIRRDPTTAPTPLIQVSQEQLLSTGLSTVIDYLATIPALSNSVVPSDTTGSGLNDGGLSLPNLRSLGVGRTLTLVDGRRHVGSQTPGSLAVDIDTIPRLLIENIEIVTGGASSVYGADAVSGVLNFVLRKDFEGLEIDGNLAMINEDGQTSKRFSALIGKNFFDDRLNLYAHGEYEKLDEVVSTDMDWLRRSPTLFGIDADPTAILNGPNDDGVIDNLIISSNELRRLDRPRWGSLTIANNQPGSSLNDPDVTQSTCTGYNAAACYSVDPAKTYWFDGTTARLANFGQRVGNTGASRPYTIGGDGESPVLFSTENRLPSSESQRYQVGGNLKITDNINLYGEAKYVTEETIDASQPTFFDVYLADNRAANVVNGSGNATNTIATSSFQMRYSDNAYLPANVKAAIASNVLINYNAPTTPTATNPTSLPSTPTGTTTAAAFADHRMFGPQRYQDNNRDLQRYVVDLNGSYDKVLFIKNFDWDVSYTYGEVHNTNEEYGVDVQRFQFAADSVVDTAGVLGTPGAIVCRVKLIAAGNPALATGPAGALYDSARGGDIRSSVEGKKAIDTCQPLNIFGAGNQSQAGLDYVNTFITVNEYNRQSDAIASVSGQLWDFWGAGAIGLAVGYEYRKEETEGVGRSAGTGDRVLFLNTGADFGLASYTSNEAFAELSVPLMRDSFLGEYAELSGSYRYADYSTVGETEVYGVNFVYRPVHDLAFKTSYNTSIRVPSLSENFAPLSQTFANSFSDPCDTRNITAALTATYTAENRANRITNCTTLAAAKGLSYDFAGTTASADDDYNPLYSSGVAGVNGGNPFLQPEESTSFTFSTVFQPRFIPNLSVVLDYYEIEITNVIQSVTAPVAATNCVNNVGLNTAACATIFRNNPAVAGTTAVLRSEAFKVGAPAGDPFGGFIQGSINYAKRTVRGLDFTARYSFDTEEMLGRDFGQFSYSLNGSWLIEQKQFTDIAFPNTFNELSSTVFYPRVRFTSALAWKPIDTLTLTWTADWQSSQDLSQLRSFISNLDSQPIEYRETGNFVRNDFAVRYDLTDDVTLRAGVTNVFDAEQAPWLGTTLYSNFDPYGRRFNVGLNWRVW
ncbi:TonB-dependent receptor domain-containing protein [Brevundimonas goettingensis]|uniref:TonB-dependent receptor n=1 Tax=Brevundimonas goettingensis TaxID=2774190 RepID=A0A975C117_9CAUL|nr:TonB-dependent receptor [Brevundimonas goettingensis]QTC91831.1 TonB-dependent receptor [Brevundimonas goettingensis]